MRSFSKRGQTIRRRSCIPLNSQDSELLHCAPEVQLSRFTIAAAVVAIIGFRTPHPLQWSTEPVSVARKGARLRSTWRPRRQTGTKTSIDLVRSPIKIIQFFEHFLRNEQL